MDTYVETEDRLQLLMDLVQKYRPAALDDIFDYNAGSG